MLGTARDKATRRAGKAGGDTHAILVNDLVLVHDSVLPSVASAIAPPRVLERHRFTNLVDDLFAILDAAACQG